jgi:hypothetical protein
VTYFFEDEAEQGTGTGGADVEAKLMAMRAQELSPQGRRQVMALLDLVERYEKADRESPGAT